MTINNPILSDHFKSRKPSAVRLAQIKYQEREVKPEAVINVGIGNVSLPVNPAMEKRLNKLNVPGSPFEGGVIKYTGTAGTEECQNAFKNILASAGINTSKMNIQITDGGSAAMEILITGVCGGAGTFDKPLLMIDPAYTNYTSFANRLGRRIDTINRTLTEEGDFTLPDMQKIEEAIKEYEPGALLIIPYDNPTGQLYDYETIKDLAKLCVKYNIWLVSDEAYRELHYAEDAKVVSIWRLTEQEVPGIEGRRISIETASKVWNACGLRIGALITDNSEFHNRAVAEYTANLCANAIGQYIFGALAHESEKEITEWTKKIRTYYGKQISKVYNRFKELDSKLIVSKPSASIYTVVDVRNVVKSGFNANDFVLYCAQKGAVKVDGVETTLLLAPMNGFYNVEKDCKNPGNTQFRISFVETPENISKVPYLFVELLKQYEEIR